MAQLSKNERDEDEFTDNVCDILQRRRNLRSDLAVVPVGTTEDKLIELWVRLKKSPHTLRS